MTVVAGETLAKGGFEVGDRLARLTCIHAIPSTVTEFLE